MKPAESTQARNFSGSRRYSMSGRPTNQVMASVSAMKTAIEAAAIIFFARSPSSGRGFSGHGDFLSQRRMYMRFYHNPIYVIFRNYK